MLSPAERALLVDQALALIEQAYVHLPLKRAMHATDPLQSLKLLKRRLAQPEPPPEAAFHAELLSIFTHLRDLHTNYILPDPFRTSTAYLPFRLDELFDGDERAYMVTEIKPGHEDKARLFESGVLVTHWNGVPIERAVEMNADREGGSNLAARHARGLAAMTLRPLAMSLPPDEEWVIVTYETTRGRREKKFSWQVFRQAGPDAGVDAETAQTDGAAGADEPSAAGRADDLAFMLGLDAKAELERQARKLLFAPEAVAITRQVRQITESIQAGKPLANAVDFSTVSRLPDMLSFRIVETPAGSFGCIRIHTFKLPAGAGVDAFIEEFIRIAALLPQNGLILDVRGNGGGHIVAGERLLQLLTPGPIEPERFYFINSPLTLRICDTQPSMAAWRESIAQAVETGAAFSDGFPLLPPGAYNDRGQHYQGPVVLVINARCYSTTDIFCAGFQDHGIGRILGTSSTTGAGGANVWRHEDLVRLFGSGESPFRPLPGNASFRVAIRRCTRVGKRAGTLVEDLGVIPDEVHRPTRRDLLQDDADLMARAAGILAAMPVRTVAARLLTALTALSPAGASGTGRRSRRLEVTTGNVDRLDLFVDRRPYRSVDVTDGTARIDLRKVPVDAMMLEVRGFWQDAWVATTRVTLERRGDD